VDSESGCCKVAPGSNPDPIPYGGPFGLSCCDVEILSRLQRHGRRNHMIVMMYECLNERKTIFQKEWKSANKPEINKLFIIRET
jgi:hypothetical protein